MEVPGHTDNSDDVEMIQHAIEHSLTEQAEKVEHKSDAVSNGEDSKNADKEGEKNELTEPRICEKIAPAQDLIMHQENNQCISLPDQSAQEQQALKRHMGDLEDGDEKRQKIEDALKEQTIGVGSVGDDPDDVGEDGPKTKLTEFTIYEKLFPKLRLHVLSFVGYKTLKKYGQLSKDCRDEFKMFERPYRVELHEVGDGVVVTMAYKIEARVKSKKFVFSDDDNYEMDNVLEYIMKKLKTSNPLEVVIDMKHWPTKMMNDSPIGFSKKLHVTLNKSMYEKFWKFLDTQEDEYSINIKWLKKLYLNECDEVDERVVLRREFFKLQFLDDLEKLTISTKFGIDADDFLARSFRDLQLTNSNWFDMDALRRKIEIETGRTDEEITIVLSPDMEQTFDTAQIVSPEHFTETSEEVTSDMNGYVTVETSDDGKKLRLKLVYESHEDDDDDSDQDEMDFY